MFTDLIALGQDCTKAYARARALVIGWLKAYPLKTNLWGPFFEDIPTADYSDTEINADTLAAYVLQHPEWDPAWREQAKGIPAWSSSMFENREYIKWGVTVINEQTVYKVPGNSHTSRHASVALLYCEKTGDCERKDDAIRQLNWATYTVDTDGKNRYIRDSNWLTDGYGDYIRHYLRAMASAPELAPGGSEPPSTNFLGDSVHAIRHRPRRIFEIRRPIHRRLQDGGVAAESRARRKDGVEPCDESAEGPRHGENRHHPCREVSARRTAAPSREGPPLLILALSQDLSCILEASAPAR